MVFNYAKELPENKDIAKIELKENGETYLTIEDGRKVLHLSIPEKNKINRRKFINLMRRVVTQAKSHKIKKFAVDFNDFKFKHLKISDADLGRLLATNFEMANFEFVTYKRAPKNGWNFIEEVTVLGNISQAVKKAVQAGSTIGLEVNKTRSLCNTPGGEMTPRLLAESAKAAAKGTKVKVKVLEKSEITKLKMGGMLGVSQGSVEPPKFIIMEYLAGRKSDKPTVLVGKGVTFDTGGINLKPSEHISDMQMDMSGGAAVIHTIVLAAKLKLKKNIVALVPAVENMPSGSSYRPGDILKTMSGITLEVGNTDAEGRIILADALTYAKKYDPKLVIDVATLTGAAAVALGQHASAIFTKDDKLAQKLQTVGEECGDYVWGLPLWDEFENEIKGTFADWSNIGKTRYGGASHAAIFLYQWAKDYPWVHIDIAPRMTAAEGDNLAKGAAGAPVRLLISYLEKN